MTRRRANERRRDGAVAAGGPAWFVYMLECERDCIYTGVAVDVAARFAQHCSGKGAAYTRANPPRRILAVKRCSTRSKALKLEYELKGLPRPEKLRWAARFASRFRPRRPARSAHRAPAAMPSAR